MHSEILNDRQVELLPLMAQFRREYYLVGGTAIALYIGHRRSIDFDMFKPSLINHKRNLDKISTAPFAHTVTRRVTEQMNLILNDVKVTFFQYPFPVEPTAKFENYFRLPSLLQCKFTQVLRETYKVRELLPSALAATACCHEGIRPWSPFQVEGLRRPLFSVE